MTLRGRKCSFNSNLDEVYAATARRIISSARYQYQSFPVSSLGVTSNFLQQFCDSPDAVGIHPWRSVFFPQRDPELTVAGESWRKYCGDSCKPSGHSSNRGVPHRRLLDPGSVAQSEAGRSAPAVRSLQKRFGILAPRRLAPTVHLVEISYLFRRNERQAGSPGC